MIDLLPQFLLNEPRRLVALGRGMARFGGFVLVVGAFGHAATTATTAVQGMARQSGTARGLAYLYPSLPTWWVPESIIGCLPAVILIGVGLSLASLGKRLQRAFF